MNPENTYGLAALIAQSDWVGRSALALLVAMSLASWYSIVQRLIEGWLAARDRQRFLSRLRAATDVEALALAVAQPGGEAVFAPVAARALEALAHCREHGAQRLDPSATPQEFVGLALRCAIAEQRLAAERGLTLLASVGATAPFVGLFGTVWGVYHALVGIGLSGQGTLDKVAGPVGEALIMTALGLVVAVPAVLAYNAFTRGNRVLAARLEGFAHELLARLASGAPLVQPERG